LRSQLLDLRGQKIQTDEMNDALRSDLTRIRRQIDEHKPILEEKEAKNRQTLKIMLDSMKRDQNALVRQTEFFDAQNAKLNKDLADADREVAALEVVAAELKKKSAVLGREASDLAWDLEDDPFSPVLEVAFEQLVEMFLNEKALSVEAERAVMMRRLGDEDAGDDDEDDGTAAEAIAAARRGEASKD